MRLAILSHTEHCQIDGRWQGLAPTVREIDEVSRHFDEVVHVACGYDQLDGCQLQAYSSKNVRFSCLRPSGGDRMRDKIGILAAAPANLRTMLREAAQADVVQVRLPTGMGIYLLPALRTVATPVWAKYAGNWMQEPAPLSYRLQRWWLRHRFAGPVTVNGSWPGMEPHIVAFENPCLTEQEMTRAGMRAAARSAKVPVRFCFVGRLEPEKGVGRILQALTELSGKERVESVHFVGEGAEKAEWQRRASGTGVECVFHGLLGREDLEAVYASSHYLLLPSDSEGFPKVVAEAAAFGVIPIVSAVSAVPQYVNSSNGYLWPTGESFSEWFSAQDFFTVPRMQSMSEEIRKLATLFTYERYCSRLRSEILPRLGCKYQ